MIQIIMIIDDLWIFRNSIKFLNIEFIIQTLRIIVWINVDLQKYENHGKYIQSKWDFVGLTSNSTLQQDIYNPNYTKKESSFSSTEVHAKAKQLAV